MSENTTASTRATREQLEELHGSLCRTFLEYLRDTPREKLRAEMMANIRGFLKDNGITKSLSRAKDISASLEELSGLSIPFLPDTFS